MRKCPMCGANLEGFSLTSKVQNLYCPNRHFSASLLPPEELERMRELILKARSTSGRDIEGTPAASQ